MERRTAGIVSLALGTSLLTGVGIGAVVAGRSSSSGPAAPAHHVAAPVTVTMAPAAVKGRIPFTGALRVGVKGGRLVSALVAGPAGALNGQVARGTWTTGARLLPGSTYIVSVRYIDSLGRTHTKTQKVRTTDSPQHVTATITPGDDDVVGVGQPVVVDFDRPIPDAAKAAVVRGLSVYSTPDVEGAWRWYNDTEIHYRPKVYWPAHTKIRVVADMRGVQLDAETWGTGVHTSSYSIGDRHVSVADAATHTLTVYENNKVIRTFPMSAGSPKYPTKSGVHIALEKSPEVIMDSETVGIPRKSPDGYYEKVQWDVRISNGGAFVHSAPWSVGAQGSSNVSHGCINLAPANAEWFYGWSLKGDVVSVVNTGVPPVTGDEGMADWNYTWDEWRSGT
ncbi:MAG TPA: Ig-like domain-containing protein [Mycobacteriales bacterium]|nr:Ig-like domain-containing protein [Mycobacteriales bacterium]